MINMILIRPIFLFVLALTLSPCISQNAQANSEEFHSSIGLGALSLQRAETSNTSFSPVVPELVGYGYVPLNRDFWLRPGLRLNYNWQQPNMPSALQVKEYDLFFNPEIGFMFNWIVVPSLTVGAGLDYRVTSFEVGAPVSSSNDMISQTKFLPFLEAQFGVGIPMFHGKFQLEPYVRYLKVSKDPRYSWVFGTEGTVLLF